MAAARPPITERRGHGVARPICLDGTELMEKIERLKRLGRRRRRQTSCRDRSITAHENAPKAADCHIFRSTNSSYMTLLKLHWFDRCRFIVQQQATTNPQEIETMNIFIHQNLVATK